jgi:hypothetical protein
MIAWGRTLVVAVLLLLVLAPAADARRAPRGFFGVSLNVGARGSPFEGDQQWNLLARTGVESVRVLFSWPDAQPSAAAPFDFSRTDVLVGQAARRGISLLPIVFDSPRWAGASPAARHSPPRDPGDYATYLGALVARYGGRGSFWNEHPELPRRPVRAWQIWNEPHLPFYWDAPEGSAQAWPGGYVRLLWASWLAVKSADPRARVVLSGLTNESWNHLERLYGHGVAQYFDVVAIHVYTAKVRNVLRAVRMNRHVMTRNHDRRKPLWVTELSWPAARGRESDPGLDRVITTDRGMARRLSAGYASLVRARRRLHVGRVFWYTWASDYRPGREGTVFHYAGLLRAGGGTFEPRPAFYAYRRTARRFEGCAKTSTGRCRRSHR